MELKVVSVISHQIQPVHFAFDVFDTYKSNNNYCITPPLDSSSMNKMKWNVVKKSGFYYSSGFLKTLLDILIFFGTILHMYWFQLLFQDPPELFSDDGTLTPDPHHEGTDESPIHMGSRTLATKPGHPDNALKTLRINRKDVKKSGGGLRGKNVTEQFRVKEKDMKRTMKWRTPEISMKNLRRPEKPGKQPDKSSGTPMSDNGKKHQRPRRRGYENDIEDNEDSTEDMLDEDDEDESSVYRKISERRTEISRARKNGDDCHVSWYSALPDLDGRGYSRENGHDDENAILLLGQDRLVAVCNGKKSSIERAREKSSSKVWFV
jgi:hypothetical protein